MTITLGQLGLYAAALAVLFLTPGPVWVALVARGISGGFRAAWPLAFGVVVGDMIWPLLAIFGVSYIVSIYGDFLLLLRWGAVGMFAVMGILLIRHAELSLSNDPRLTRPGNWAGFAAGVLVIAGNPKAILFYMGLLPGFFDLALFTGADIAAIVVLSALVPLVGNLILALFVDRVRRFLSSPGALRRANFGAGIALIGVAVAIALIGA